MSAHAETHSNAPAGEPEAHVMARHFRTVVRLLRPPVSLMILFQIPYLALYFRESERDERAKLRKR